MADSTNDMLKGIETLLNANSKQLMQISELGIAAKFTNYVNSLRSTFKGEVKSSEVATLAQSSLDLWTDMYDWLSKQSQYSNASIFDDTIKEKVKAFGIVSSVLGLSASVLAASDKLNEKKWYEIVSDYMNCGKDVFSIVEEVYKFKDNPISKLSDGGVYSPLWVYGAIAKAGISCVSQLVRSIGEYKDDGKWTLDDTANTGIDFATAGLYEITHFLTLGLDEVIYKAIYKATGRTGDVNFAEEIANGFKMAGTTIGNTIGNMIVNRIQKKRDKERITFEVYGDAFFIEGGTKADKIYGSDGNDTLKGGNANDSLYGYNGNDSLYGDVGNDKLYGETGDDKLFGGAGKDSLYGGTGNDSIYGESNTDKLYGDAGDDFLSGGDSKDTLYGGDGNDSLYGDTSDDKLFGDSGNDTLVGGTGKDTLTGGSGSDIYYYSNGDGNDLILDYVSGEDKIKIASGSISKYSVSGGKNAVLTIVKGKVTLKGIGNDRIEVITADNKTVYYGGIDDGLKFNESDLSKATAVTISSAYNQSKFDSAGYSSLATLKASSRTNAIEIIGNKKSNKIYGGSAADILRGGDSKDTIYGGDGNDSLYGDKYADKLFGDAGNDTLIGGLGNDTMTGGAGSDIFYYSLGDGADVIADFTENEDKIYINGVSSVTGSLSGSDVKFKVGNGSNSIEVKKAKNKTITIVYSNGKEEQYINGVLSSGKPNTDDKVDYNAMTVTLNDSMTNPFKLDDYNKTVNSPIVISTGNASNPFNLDAYKETGSITFINIDGTKLTKSFTIYGDDKANVIKAGGDSYYDTQVIYGCKGNDDLYSSSIARTYFYYNKGDGNDTLYNLKNDDRIELKDVSVKNVSVTNSDIYLNLNDGNVLTLRNSMNKSIYISGLYSQIYASSTVKDNKFVLDANSYGHFDIKEHDANATKNITQIDATASKNVLTIYGDDKANVIKAGGDSYYDTQVIYGCKGNDDLYSSSIARTYFYYNKGDGNDTLYNLKNSDHIELKDVKVSNITHGTSDINVNLDDGSKLTLKNSANAKIYISGYGYYTYSTKTTSSSADIASDIIDSMWFAEDSNLMSADSNIDSILDEAYTVTNIETPTYGLIEDDKLMFSYSANEKHQ